MSRQDKTKLVVGEGGKLLGATYKAGYGRTTVFDMYDPSMSGLSYSDKTVRLVNWLLDRMPWDGDTEEAMCLQNNDTLRR